MFLGLLLPILAGCAGLSGTKKSEGPDMSGPYFYPEHDGSGYTLAVLQPEGVNLREDRDPYLLDLIQGSVNEDFSKFSRIKLVNRRDLDLVIEQQQLSLSGDFSEDDFIKIGNLTNAPYILSGRLTAVSRREFNLVLNITELETGEVKATIGKNQLSAMDIKRGVVMKEVSRNLLEQLGVVLTPAGINAMAAEAQASADAQAKLAQSRAAGRSGNRIAGLVNAMGAKDRDASLLEVEDQLRAANRAMSSGGLGLEIQEDYARQQSWNEQLIEFETYYRDYAPFDIVYTPGLEQTGINYNAGTADFEFIIGLQPSRELPIMQKVLRAVLSDLTKTRNKQKWGFGEWPQREIEYNLYRERRFNIIVGLFDEDDEEIHRVPVTLYSQLLLDNTTIKFDATQRVPVSMKNISIDALTGDMKVRLISINDVDAQDAEEDGFWTYTPVTLAKFPRAKRPTIPEKYRTIVQPGTETSQKGTTTAATQRPAPAPQAPKPQKPKKPPRQSQRLDYRVGMGVGGMFNPQTPVEKTSLAVSLEMGFQSFALEGLFMWPFDQEMYSDPAEEPANVFTIGGAIGYTFVTQYVLPSLSFGVTYTGLPGGEKVIAPYGLLKADLMPWGEGFGVRLGFMAEAGSVEWGDAYYRYYQWPLINNGAFRMNGKVLVGMILWM
jgi:hypothetical protein